MTVRERKGINMKLHQEQPPISHGGLRHTVQSMAEKMLWQELRNKKLAGLKFQRSHHVGHHVVPFYCEELSLAIEVGGSEKNSQSRTVANGHRSESLRELGVTVLKFHSKDVRSHMERVLQTIRNTTDRNFPISSYLHFEGIRKRNLS